MGWNLWDILCGTESTGHIPSDGIYGAYSVRRKRLVKREPVGRFKLTAVRNNAQEIEMMSNEVETAPMKLKCLIVFNDHIKQFIQRIIKKA